MYAMFSLIFYWVASLAPGNCGIVRVKLPKRLWLKLSRAKPQQHMTNIHQVHISWHVFCESLAVVYGPHDVEILYSVWFTLGLHIKRMVKFCESYMEKL